MASGGTDAANPLPHTDKQACPALAPPYDGGNPDHDSVAFVVDATCRDDREESAAPAIFEYAFYPSSPGHFRTGESLPSRTASVSAPGWTMVVDYDGRQNGALIGNKPANGWCLQLVHCSEPIIGATPAGTEY